MSFWSKLFGVTKKVGETALELSIVAIHVDALEKSIQAIGRGTPVTPEHIAAMLSNVDAIRAGINDIRH